MREEHNSDVKQLIEARDNRSVLKIRVLAFAAACGDGNIFAFEGDDDKVVFGQWIARLAPEMNYEPFICGGKRSSRTLSCILEEDAGILRRRVALFVDRDFDDLEGFCSIPRLYMTDRYSIENYLVCDSVMEAILRDHFPLDGQPGERTALLDHFRISYGRFLQLTRDANFRLYVAAKESIQRPADFNPRLSHLVKFSLYQIEAADEPLEQTIPLTKEPTVDQRANWQADFDCLSGELRYRGKFAFSFFRAFLRELSSACRRGCPILFNGQPRTNVREGEFSLGNLAARASLPIGLSEFLFGL